MLPRSLTYENAIRQPSRSFTTRLLVDNVGIIEDAIERVELHEISASGDAITIGDFCTNKIEVSMFNRRKEGTAPVRVNSTVNVQFGLELGEESIEWVNCGSYRIPEDEFEADDYRITFTAYDRSYWFNVPYEPSVSFPASFESVVSDLARQCSVTVETYDVPSHTIEGIPDNVTCKEMFGYLGAVMGKNVRINRNGNLEFYWYTDTTHTIDKSQIYMNTVKTEGTNTTCIQSVTVHNGEQSFSTGTGVGIVVENPYITPEILETIASHILSTYYERGELKWQGDPSITPYDIISVADVTNENDNVYVRMILTENITVLTGMNAKSKSKGQLKEDVAMSMSPTEIKIQRMYNTLVSSFKNTTETILGHNGGHFVVETDSEGHPRGWTVMDTPALTDSTKLWRMTMGGMGFSEDGGKTFKNIAFDMDGNFNANAITTGVLQGETFEFNLDEGTIKLGVRDEDGVISKPALFVNALGELEIGQIATEFERMHSHDVVKSNTAPDNKDVLWCDTKTNPPLLKQYNTSTSKWEEVVDTEQITKWARFENGVLSLGQSDSPFTMKLDNQELGFYNNDVKMSYFSSRRMHITNASIDETLDIHNQIRFMYMKSSTNEGVGIVPIVQGG